MPAYAITVSQMRAWEEQTWAEGQTAANVIARVGLAVARTALDLTRPGDSILLLAGKGNNGKDALAARAHLKDRGVALLQVIDPAAARPRLLSALKMRPSLIVDGLFGIGLNRPLSAEWIAFIQAINEARLPVLAVDVPSGLNADTGEPEGAVIRARVTLTVGAPKTGLLPFSAAGYVGRLEVASDVGLSATPPRSDLSWMLASDFENFPPHREVTSHKGTHGHLAILAGSKGYHGAAVLCARAAQRAQPGLVTLATLESVYVPVASQLQAVMVRTWNPADFAEPDDGKPRWDAIAIGPGLAATEVPDEMKTWLRDAWKRSATALIVDASALAWLEPGPIETSAMRVITPHPGEAARMLGGDETARDVQNDRCAALRTLSELYGNTWVILKGHQTLIGRAKGPLHVNSTGNPYMAQGGSGDVLTGYLGGLIAQPGLLESPERVLPYAVWRHGRAGDLLQRSEGAWIVEEVLEKLKAWPF